MKRFAVVAVAVLVLLTIAAPAQARGVERARMEIENVVGFGVNDGAELLTYVGTLEFRRGRTYDIAFFSPLAPPPDDPDFFDKWVRFDGRWAIYPAGTLYLDYGPGDPPVFPTEEPLRTEPDGGWAHFALNKFIGWGPGGMWTGKFVDGDGQPAPFHPPSGQFNTQFVGPFWLFGGL